MASVIKSSTDYDDGKTIAVDNLLHIVVGGKTLLIRSSEIREVVRPVPLTRVPMGPEHVIGLTNIHGQIVCIIDIGGVTLLPPCKRQQTSRTRFLILKHPVMHVGIWADEVCSIKQANVGLPTGIAAADAPLEQIDIDGISYNLLTCACLFDMK